MKVTDNHRARQERRRRDASPPAGCSERRREPERRLPVMEESTLSDSDWQKFFGTPLHPSEKSDHKLFQAGGAVGKANNG